MVTEVAYIKFRTVRQRPGISRHGSASLSLQGYPPGTARPRRHL